MQQKPLRKTIGILALVVGLMFGFSFALVPLYKVACKKIGLNTSVPITSIPDGAVPSSEANFSRDVTVQFLAMTNQDLNWEFHPTIKMVKIHPGQKAKVTFYAKNNTKNDMTVQAIPSMTPGSSIAHFHKLQCFCFNQQSLKAGEEKNMVLVFQVDNSLPKDVHTISLAYTLFDVTPKVKN